VAHAFALADTSNTRGAPSFAHFAKGGIPRTLKVSAFIPNGGWATLSNAASSPNIGGTTGGAPLLALVEKWPAGRPIPIALCERVGVEMFAQRDEHTLVRNWIRLRSAGNRGLLLPPCELY
jgi:hypothetical protein